MGHPGVITPMFVTDCGARVMPIKRPDGGIEGGVTENAWDRGNWSISLDVADDTEAAVVAARGHG